MKVLSRTSDGLKRCYNVLVTLEEVEQVKTGKLQEIAKKVKMDGFRPGKVPLDVVRRLYGESVTAESKQTAIDNTARKILSDEKLSISFNYVTDIVKEDKKGIEFEMKFELIPSFDLYDFSKIKLVKHTAEVSDEESMKILENIRQSAKNWKEDTKAKKVTKGQKIEIDLKMLSKVKKHKNEKIENLEIVVGDETLVDDFWKHLVGAKINDEVEFDINYPGNFSDHVLAGKKIHYSALIKKIFKAEEFKMDDEFAKTVGYEDLGKAKTWAKSRAVARYEYISKDIMKRDLLDKITEMYDFDVPSNMVDAEEREVVKQIKLEAERLKKEFTPEIEKECHEIAIKRVRLGFVVAEIAKREKIRVSRNEVVQAIRNIAAMYPGQEKSIFDMYYNHPEAASAIIGPVLESKVVDYLLDKISPKEEKCSIEELTAIDEEPFDFFKEDADKKPAKKTTVKKNEKSSVKKSDAVKEKSVEEKATSKKKATTKKTVEKRVESGKSEEEAPKKRTRKKLNS